LDVVKRFKQSVFIINAMRKWSAIVAVKRLLLLALLFLSSHVYAAEIFGTFTVDGDIATAGTVTLYDRNFNQVSTMPTSSTGQYRLYYANAGTYYLNAVQGQASTDFIELELTVSDRNLDLNLLKNN
jgi:hypothetical protein